jgi:hypothetical protein
VDSNDIDLLGFEGVPEDDMANTTCGLLRSSYGRSELTLTEAIEDRGSSAGQGKVH